MTDFYISANVNSVPARDFADPATWEAGTQDRDLIANTEIVRGIIVEAADVFSGSINMLSVGGATTNSSYYRELTAYDGASFIDHVNVETNALRYDNTKGCAIESTVSLNNTVTIEENYFRLNRIQLNNHTSQDYATKTLEIKNCNDANIFQCIIDFNGVPVSGFPFNGFSSGTIASSICIQRKGGAGKIAALSNGFDAYNVAFVTPTGISQAIDGIQALYSAPIMKNCLVFGANDFYDDTVFTPTCTTCLSNGNSLPSGVTLTNYDTNLFVETANGSHDFKPASASSASVLAGTFDAIFAAVDIRDISFGSGDTDIGPWKYEAGGVGVSVFFLPPNTAGFKNMNGYLQG